MTPSRESASESGKSPTVEKAVFSLMAKRAKAGASAAELDTYARAYLSEAREAARRKEAESDAPR